MMVRLAFASEDDSGLDSRISSHFGRCPYYTFVDVEGRKVMNVEVKANPYFDAHMPGAIPQFIASEGAKVVFAGGMGPRAVEKFNGLDIQPIGEVD